ncbi:MAG TPA: 2-amino-4-hydroxy-6-hydroxymethyldihydropteridine diphosphokinase [Verrucomicrobiae bacterium]|nr:2-amino-4-hydroxy-6-hydroxymethyldihydropteridine diphosphokinase [Verrucomicrobiae bacterium]
MSSDSIDSGANGSERAYIALGSNLGDSGALLREAFRVLQGLSAAPLVASSLWRTTPVDCPPHSPAFINAVIALAPLPNETPEALLGKLQQIEKNFGRRPKIVMNEPRPLDLDLIAFGSETRNFPQLILPHPRAHLRRFVLEPLAEIAPEFVLPGQKKTVRELLEALRTDEVTAKI